jgi:hypothetical protein
VLAALTDHLWQSLLFCSLGAMLAWLARRNPARVRLWLWRICALKLVLPFALLFALGRWLGFPVSHSADPVPAELLRAADALAPLLAPAQSARVGARTASLCVLVLMPAIVLLVPWLRRALRIERARLEQESACLDLDPDSGPPGLGFFNSALFTFCAIVIFSGVLLAGGIADRLWRQELLVTHARALRGAAITMIEAAPGMGSRSRIEAGPNGVLIRNTSIQDLIALAYGVNHYAVWATQMTSSDAAESRSWLLSPRYDVHVGARIVDPEDFDPYALRQRITQFLAERFGLEIHLNDRCQPPCGVYNVPMPEEAP